MWLLAEGTQLEAKGTEMPQRQPSQATPSESQIYADIVQSMQVGVHVWRLVDRTDAYSLVLVTSNPIAQQMTNRSVKSLVGKRIAECFPTVPQEHVELIARVARSGIPETKPETEYGDDRTHGIYSCKVFPLPHQCAGVAFENITERKRAEMQMQERADELSRVNKLLTHTTLLLEERNRELDQFAYVASHDLKAPLRAIANLSEWIEEDLGDRLPDENQRQMQLLRGRVHRMESLINGLLQYSRVGRTQVLAETLSVETLLNEVIDSLAPPDSFKVEVAPHMPTLNSKALLLRQVFSNLIGNAIQHHPRSNGSVAIAFQDQGLSYEFIVADDGRGIAPEHYEKIFAIFHTLESRDTESTGIGLSIVKKIIETEGGTIQVESQLGVGTTFRFTWPKCPRD